MFMETDTTACIYIYTGRHQILLLVHVLVHFLNEI